MSYHKVISEVTDPMGRWFISGTVRSAVRQLEETKDKYVALETQRSRELTAALKWSDELQGRAQRAEADLKDTEAARLLLLVQAQRMGDETESLRQAVDATMADLAYAHAEVKSRDEVIARLEQYLAQANTDVITLTRNTQELTADLRKNRLSLVESNERTSELEDIIANARSALEPKRIDDDIPF